MKKEECIFCRIIKGEVPSKKVYETKEFLVIKDINQKVKGHSLVITKKHYEKFTDMPERLYKNFMKTTKETAVKLMKEVNGEAFNFVLNNGSIAGQIVPHLHLHIFPRKKKDNFCIGF